LIRSIFTQTAKRCWWSWSNSLDLFWVFKVRVLHVQSFLLEPDLGLGVAITNPSELAAMASFLRPPTQSSTWFPIFPNFRLRIIVAFAALLHSHCNLSHCNLSLISTSKASTMWKTVAWAVSFIAKVIDIEVGASAFDLRTENG